MNAGSGGPPLPDYGRSALSDLVPSLLGALGAPGFAGPLGIEPAASAGILVVDGLGWEGLLAHPNEAPFLTEAARSGRPLTAGFPSTTASSLGSIGTGRPPGEHGLVGYAMAVPGHDRAMNALKWELYGSGPKVGLLEELPPERLQPLPTAFERAAAGGVDVWLVGPPHLAGSPLERAVLRGGRYHAAHSLGDLAAGVLRRLSGARALVYAYHPALDTTGHVRGCGSEAWALELSQVDRLVATVAERLPSGALLAVTGDHGMVDVPEEGRLELDDRPDLAAGVRLLAGEARARHVHAVEGAAEDVLAAWRGLLGDRMWIATREQAVQEGWFGPRVHDRVRPRIGDLVAAARTDVGVFQRRVDAMQAALVGHHGSMTAAEQLVPLLLVRG